MRSFFNLALLLGCVSFVNIQGYTAQASTDAHAIEPKAGQSQLAKLLSDTFKDDQSASPLTGAPDSSSRLADVVVGHMRTGNNEQLHRLFYQPDVGAWSVFYQQVTQRQFSTVDLIDLLDQTKSKIFTAYSGKSVGDKDAYFYIPTLFDQLMQQIFAGRWGFSDEPTPDDVIDRLKGVYGRVVSGLATVHEYYPLHIIKSLESKKEKSLPTETAHFTALQECAAAVYSHLRVASGVAPYSVDDFKKSTNVSFFQPSFEKTLGQIHYQNPLSYIYGHPNFRTLARSLINLEKEVEREDTYTDENESSHDRIKKLIQAQYSGIFVNFAMTSSERVLAALCDPLTVTQERYVILTRKSGETTYSERQLFVAQADSIVPLSINSTTQYLLYKGLDGKACVKKLVGDTLEDALPPHETITNWDDVEFDSQGLLLFATHVTNHGRKVQYWTLKEGEWHLLHKGKTWEQSLRKVDSTGTDRVYRSSYSDGGLTLEFLNLEASVFEPTNVMNTPVSVVDAAGQKVVFIASQKDPHVIVALKNYQDGVVGWTFLNAAISAQYDSFIKKLRAKWTAEDRHFTDAPFGVLDFNLEDDQVCEARFQFHQNPEIGGTATLHGEEVSVEWHNRMDRSLPLHQPLQTQNVKVDGHDVPYYYVPPAVAGNKKTVILMQGGPLVVMKETLPT